MVKPFSNKVKRLKVGQISKPFKTKFGWHLVKLEGVRKAQLPNFDKLYPELQRQLSFKAVNDYVNNIKKDVKVEIVNKEK
jgi:parvulin-like peptidyl-prolyl isomerase